MPIPLPFLARLSLLSRVMISATLALVVAGNALLIISTAGDAEFFAAQIAENLEGELDSLVIALGEPVIIGDYATIEQSLQVRAKRADVRRVVWTDKKGKTVEAALPAAAPRAPAWFARLTRITAQHGSRALVIGGRTYGTIEVEVSATAAHDRLWEDFIRHLGILALALGLDFAGILLVLKSGLRPLARLTQAANDLANGDFSSRIPPKGSPELLRVIVAFNHMADATQTAQRKWRFSNEELHRLTEITAHHLQEPARRLVVFAGRLKASLASQTLNEDAALSLTFIEQQANRLRALLRDIQFYLAVEQPMGEVGTILLSEAAEAALTGHQAALAAAEAEVSTDTAEVRLHIDRRRLIKLLDTLLDNALRYRRPDTPPRIHIAATALGGRVHLRVADNGLGIAPQYRTQVFQVFERLHPVAGDDNTGIGLSLVRRIVESENGRVWIEETPGGGATVILDLPQGTEA